MFTAGLRWAMFVPLSMAFQAPFLAAKLTLLDSLPHRSHNHNRAAEDNALLCAQAEIKRHSSVLRWARSYLDALGTCWLLSRVIRHLHPIW